MKTAVNLLESCEKENTELKPYKYKYDGLHEMTSEKVKELNNKINLLEKEREEKQSTSNEEFNNFDGQLERFMKCYSRTLGDDERKTIDEELNEYFAKL